MFPGYLCRLIGFLPTSIGCSHGHLSHEVPWATTWLGTWPSPTASVWFGIARRPRPRCSRCNKCNWPWFFWRFWRFLSILLSTCGVSNPGGPAAFPGVWLQCGGQAARLGIQSGWVGIAWQHVSEKIEWIALSQFNGFHPNCLTRKVLIFCLPTSEEDETIVEQASLFVSRFLGWHPGK